MGVGGGGGQGASVGRPGTFRFSHAPCGFKFIFFFPPPPQGFRESLFALKHRGGVERTCQEEGRKEASKAHNVEALERLPRRHVPSTRRRRRRVGARERRRASLVFVLRRHRRRSTDEKLHAGASPRSEPSDSEGESLESNVHRVATLRAARQDERAKNVMLVVVASGDARCVQKLRWSAQLRALTPCGSRHGRRRGWSCSRRSACRRRRARRRH